MHIYVMRLTNENPCHTHVLALCAITKESLEGIVVQSNRQFLLHRTPGYKKLIYPVSLPLDEKAYWSYLRDRQ